MDESITLIVLNEIKRWVAGKGWFDKQTVMGVDAKWAALLTLALIILFSMAKALTNAWAGGQMVCLVPAVLCYILVNGQWPSRPQAIDFGYATILSALALTSAMLLPFVLITGIGRVDWSDILYYSLSLLLTLFLIRVNWKNAITRARSKR